MEGYMFPFMPFAWPLVARSGDHFFQTAGRTGWPRVGRARRAVAVLCGLVLVAGAVARVRGTPPIKSGVRTLAADQAMLPPLDRTMFVLAPDFVGPTFGYYFRNTAATFFGFARWDHPELFSPQGYAQLWSARGNVEATADRIREEARRQHARWVLFVHSPRRNAGQVEYQRADALLDVLRRTYPLEQTRDYPGSEEDVTVYRFRVPEP
jgi:hypothetical protein